MAICPSGHFHTRCGVYVYLIRAFQSLSQIDKLLHTFVVFWPAWSGRQTSSPMNLISRLEPHLQERYETPAAELYSLEIEDTLAKSNTEQIIEDDDEYGWN